MGSSFRGELRGRVSGRRPAGLSALGLGPPEVTPVRVQCLCFPLFPSLQKTHQSLQLALTPRRPQPTTCCSEPVTERTAPGSCVGAGMQGDGPSPERPGLWPEGRGGCVFSGCVFSATAHFPGSGRDRDFFLLVAWTETSRSRCPAPQTQPRDAFSTVSARVRVPPRDTHARVGWELAPRPQPWTTGVGSYPKPARRGVNPPSRGATRPELYPELGLRSSRPFTQFRVCICSPTAGSTELRGPLRAPGGAGEGPGRS